MLLLFLNFLRSYVNINYFSLLAKGCFLVSGFYMNAMTKLRPGTASLSKKLRRVEIED